MKQFKAYHRCGTYLIIVDEDYEKGVNPYCKKCRINVKLLSPKIKTTEFKFEVVPVPVPIVNAYSQSQCQCQSRLANTI